MKKIDLSVVPDGGWTPENVKEYHEEWWRLEMERPKAEWEDVEDPEGRLKKGQRIRWGNSSAEDEGMEIIRLCAPTGLYSRPLKEDDDSPEAKFLREVNKRETKLLKKVIKRSGEFCKKHGKYIPDFSYKLSCDKDHPEANYEPERLMVFFRYIHSDTATTGQAINMVVVDDSVPNGRAIK
jgi:hypothetical protein